jgi:hypothetical protein
VAQPSVSHLSNSDPRSKNPEAGNCIRKKDLTCFLATSNVIKEQIARFAKQGDVSRSSRFQAKGCNCGIKLQIGAVALETLEMLGPNVVPNNVKTVLLSTLCCSLEQALLAVDGHFVSEHASEICVYWHLDPRSRFHRDLTLKSRSQAAFDCHPLGNDRYTRLLRMHRTGKRRCLRDEQGAHAFRVRNRLRGFTCSVIAKNDNFRCTIS